MKSHLRTSFQEVTVSSITSLRPSIESEIKFLCTKVSDLSERINKLESSQLNLRGSAVNSDMPITSDVSPITPTVTSLCKERGMSGFQEVIHSTIKSFLSEEKEKDQRKLNLIGFQKVLQRAHLKERHVTLSN